MNILLNPSFEEYWHHPGGVAELQIPDYWDFWYAGPEVKNPIDANSWSVFRRPEVRVLDREHLPENERDLFILEGRQTAKAFKGHGAWFAGLRQAAKIPDGGMYRFTVKVYGDLVKEYTSGGKVWSDDPNGNDGLIRFTLDDKEYNFESIQPGQWNTYTLDFVADVGSLSIGVDFMCPFALENSGLFLDDWRLEMMEPDDVHRGAPRVQYARTFNVIPPHATLDQARMVLEQAYDQRQTVGWSYDDAGIGDLDKRSAVLYGIPEIEKKNFTEFYQQYYPGVTVSFRPLPGDQPPPPPPPPPPPLHTLITLHMQTLVGWWDGYFRTLANAGIPARWVKFVGGMESSRVVEAATEGATKTVYRHYVESQRQEQLLDRAVNDPYGAANSYLDEFFDGVLRNPVHAVESINEVIECGNVTKINKAVKFDAAFAELVYERSQGRVAPVTLTAPPGNPEHGAEVELLLPAVKATMIAEGYIGAHTYFPANGTHTEGWMETEGYHHHLRPLLSWDATFAKHGLEPHYLFGESGAVGVEVRADGRPGVFAPTVGWRTGYCLNGDLARYIRLLLRYQELVQEWNAAHDWRCEGFMIFTTGIGVGWHDFLFNEPEIRALADALT